MENFSAEKGTEALVAKLQAKPDYFGKSALVQSLHNRRIEARQAAVLLPLLAMTALLAREISEPETGAA